jgi:DNA-binding response OmpR family regulator
MLLDLGLPDSSGEEVPQRLRPRNPGVPVIILTARAETGDKVRAGRRR